MLIHPCIYFVFGNIWKYYPIEFFVWQIDTLHSTFIEWKYPLHHLISRKANRQHLSPARALLVKIIGGLPGMKIFLTKMDLTGKCLSNPCPQNLLALMIYQSQNTVKTQRYYSMLAIWPWLNMTISVTSHNSPCTTRSPFTSCIYKCTYILLEHNISGIYLE